IREPTGLLACCEANRQMSLTAMTLFVECFYHKDGKWYDPGTYKAFRMYDLTTQ
ncbi:hypothetical protein BKA82DRAFT_4178897, partial [Pisolithus tinctorius]